jgi:hypothetical protein
MSSPNASESTPRESGIAAAAQALAARWPLLLCCAFALLAAFETARSLLAPLQVAREADWRDATLEVRAGFRPGDLIVFAPRWADPVGRYHLGDLIPVEMAARADETHYARIWEVSIRGARAPEAAGTTLVSEHDHGKVRVALYNKAPPLRTVFDFTASLTDARVTQIPSSGRGNETPCYSDGGGFHCAGARVERRVLEVDYAPRRGILAPIDKGLVTRIAFPDVLLGTSLVGYSALHDYYARLHGEGPVEFAVFIDNQPVLEYLHRNEDGWRRFAVDTSRFRGEHHAVRFEMESAAPDWRNFGFTAETVDTEAHP